MILNFLTGGIDLLKLEQRVIALDTVIFDARGRMKSDTYDFEVEHPRVWTLSKRRSRHRPR